MAEQDNKLYYEIENDEQFYAVKKQIEDLDRTINIAYSEMQKYSDTKVIIDFQDWIDRMKLKRLGLFNLSSIYTLQNNTKRDFEEYICKYGDTLKLLAQAYYGKKEYWQYIYVYNELVNTVLTPNQRLKIPLVHPDKELVFLKDLIDTLDAI